jgi:1-deoxy-D-xylulose-5-phosphate reductoisomerase
MARRGIAVLGSTGSIGQSTLDVIARHPDRFRVVALSAHSQVDTLAEQCHAHDARYAVISDASRAGELAAALAARGSDAQVLAGEEALLDCVALDEVDTVMAAIVGAAGLRPTLRAVELGHRVLLANKEPMVIAGALFQAVCERSGALLLPVDSEHNALFQALPDGFRDGLEQAGVERLTLTASGGPFLNADPASLAGVTPDQACAHPNWDMGRKISVDSATLMNKGLEVIEARWLFNARPDQIGVVVHPQSIVHSLVSYRDGSVLAQLGMPDMRTPIAHALAWPERIEAGVATLDLARVARLDFFEPDLERFPCLGLAFAAMAAGDSGPAILNAANEIAVEAFLEGRIGFMDIPSLIEETLKSVPAGSMHTLEEVLETDREARAHTREIMRRKVERNA